MSLLDWIVGGAYYGSLFPMFLSFSLLSAVALFIVLWAEKQNRFISRIEF